MSRGELIEAVYAPNRHDPNGVMMVGSVGSQPETEANARLIAAAPEMAQLLAVSASLFHQIERELGSSVLEEIDGAGIQHQAIYDSWADRLLDRGNEIYALLTRIRGEAS